MSVTITLSENAAKFLSDLLDANDDTDALTDWGYSEEAITEARTAVAAALAPRAVTARCPDTAWDGMVGFSPSHQCPSRLTSVDELYKHLRTVHRYPEEDAGSSAWSAWDER